MYDNNMKSNYVNNTSIQPQEEFLRQVVFMKDEEKVLAVFPFYHNISDIEYEKVVSNFFNDSEHIPPRQHFCLMHEAEFGWGWIYNKMICHLELAEKDLYEELKGILITTKVIKPAFILNEE